MTNDRALAAAIAERKAAWGRCLLCPQYPLHQREYFAAVDKLRAICPHDRSEDRGYATPVCVVCGAAEPS